MFEGFRRRIPFAALTAAFLFAVPLPAPAAAHGNPSVAALQVGLRAVGLYSGPVDGVLGSETSAAVRALQRQQGLAPDGVADPRARAALGRHGRPALGARVLSTGAVGWDVAALQFSLAWRGFPSGPIDGGFGERTRAALVRYQRWAGLPADGVAGHAVFASLRRPPATVPMALRFPVSGPRGDGFGPRGDRFHTGVDFPAAAGTPVGAAASGRVVYAGWHPGGWGYLVTVAHGNGVRIMYTHLSRIDVTLGQRIASGARVGLVGATGRVTGPHLHLEVRVRGAAVDPLPALGR